MNLEPLRTALRAETDHDAQVRLDQIESECALVVAAAEERAGELVRQGRLEGEAAAAKEAARRRGAATRRAREIRLQAQRRQVEKLQQAAREAARRLRDDSRYPDLLERLAGTVRDQLGPEAEVEVDPPGQGGVIGRKGRASVDYTLPALVDWAIASLGDELGTLWR